MAIIKLVPIEPDREMTIKIKDLNAASMTLTNKGLELEFRDGNAHTGDARKLLCTQQRTSHLAARSNINAFC